MPWIEREIDKHKCDLPTHDTRRARVYDKWQCNDCKKVWIVTKVNRAQRDGDWLDFQEYESWKSSPFAPGTK